MRKRILRIFAVLVILLFLVVLGMAGGPIVRSLPVWRTRWRGRACRAVGPCHGQDDNRGIPTIRADKRDDVAFALGFVQRRSDSSKWICSAATRRASWLSWSARRWSRMTAKCAFIGFAMSPSDLLTKASSDEQSMIDSYTAGVNAGVASLGAKPFEYLLLGIEPAPWQPEDCALVMFSMYLDLQGEDYRDEATLGLLYDVLPGPLAEFLARGTEWDVADPR